MEKIYMTVGVSKDLDREFKHFMDAMRKSGRHITQDEVFEEALRAYLGRFLKN